MARNLNQLKDNEYFTLGEVARLYIRPMNDLDFPEYSAKLNQAKSVIQRAINDGQIETDGNGRINLASFREWQGREKTQRNVRISDEVWEKFRLANEGKNLSFEIEKLIAKSLEQSV